MQAKCQKLNAKKRTNKEHQKLTQKVEQAAFANSTKMLAKNALAKNTKPVLTALHFLANQTALLKLNRVALPRYLSALFQTVQKELKAIAYLEVRPSHKSLLHAGIEIRR